MSRVPLVASLVVAALLFTLPRRAQAQTTQQIATAQALFDEGKRLHKDKNFQEACPKFEASHRIDPGLGTLLYLGDCYEEIGRTASAWARSTGIVPAI